MHWQESDIVYRAWIQATLVHLSPSFSIRPLFANWRVHRYVYKLIKLVIAKVATIWTSLAPKIGSWWRMEPWKREKERQKRERSKTRNSLDCIVCSRTRVKTHWRYLSVWKEVNVCTPICYFIIPECCKGVVDWYWLIATQIFYPRYTFVAENTTLHTPSSLLLPRISPNFAHFSLPSPQ